jgi:uncharacterized membrane protein SirB2
MSYLAIKHLHILCAALSGCFFFVRGVWMMKAPALLKTRWTRIAPHLIDTVLLASALTLAVRSSQYPFVQGWLTAKVLALLLYIVLGTVALKRGRTRGIRIAAWLAALCCFGYIVAVALSRNPLPLP